MSPNNSSSATASFSCGNDNLAKLLVEYFSRFDGKTQSWAQVEPLLLKIMHRDVVLVTDEGELQHDAVIDIIEKFFKSGGQSNLAKLEPRQANGVIKLVVENIQGDGTIDVVRQWFKIKDDQIVHIEAESSPAEFGILLKNVEANSSHKRIKVLRDYFATIDGSANAWDSFEPFFETLFHPDAVFIHPGGKWSKTGFKTFTENYIQGRGTVKIENAYINGPNTAKFMLRLQTPDGDVQVHWRKATFSGEQIIKLETAEPTDPKEFEELVTGLLDDQLSHGIKLLREHFETIDGSPEAFSSYEPLFEQVYHPDAVFRHPNGQWSKEEFKQFTKKFMDCGGITKMEGIVKSGPNTIDFKLKLCTPDGNVRVQGRKATFIGNQVIKIEGTHPEKFKKFVDGVLENTIGTATPDIAQHVGLDDSQASSAA